MFNPTSHVYVMGVKHPLLPNSRVPTEVHPTCLKLFVARPFTAGFAQLHTESWGGHLRE